MNCLLDTHAFVWAVAQDHKLSKRIQELLLDPGNVPYYSPIMVWEILILAEKNKLGAVQSIQTLIRKGIDDLKLFEASLNTEIAFLSRSLRLPHQDQADRFIVATAAHYDMTLLTADERILRSGACKTIAACE